MSLNFEEVRRSMRTRLVQETAAGEAAEASDEQTFADEDEASDKIEAAKEKEEFPETKRFSLKVLLEQPEEGEEEEEDIFGDEEADEGDEGDEGDADEVEAGEEVEVEVEEEEEEEEVDVTPSETEELGKSVDDALESILVDYEAKARKSAAIQSESRYSLRRYLLKEVDGDLDVDRFTTDVARLVMNYDNLLDMEALIVNKAIQFLTTHYNEELAEEFLELLDVKHGVVIGVEEEIEQPIAVGASGGGGGGGVV